VAAKGDSAAVFDDWLIILVHVANPKILSYATPRGKVVSAVSAASVRAGQLMLRRRGEGFPRLAQRQGTTREARFVQGRASFSCPEALGPCRRLPRGRPWVPALVVAPDGTISISGPGSNRFMRLETLMPSGGSLSRTWLKMPRRVVGTMA
jgi:hypothetical protein